MTLRRDLRMDPGLLLELLWGKADPQGQDMGSAGKSSCCSSPGALGSLRGSLPPGPSSGTGSDCPQSQGGEAPTDVYWAT